MNIISTSNPKVENIMANMGKLNANKDPGDADPFLDFPSLLGDALEEATTLEESTKSQDIEEITNAILNGAPIPSAYELASLKSDEDFLQTLRQFQGTSETLPRVKFDDFSGKIAKLAAGLQKNPTQVAQGLAIAPQPQSDLKPVHTIDNVAVPVAETSLQQALSAPATHAKTIASNITTAPTSATLPINTAAPITVAETTSTATQTVDTPSFAKNVAEPQAHKSEKTAAKAPEVQVTIRNPVQSSTQVLVPVTSTIGGFASTIVQSVDGQQSTISSDPIVQNAEVAKAPSVKSIEIQLVPKSLGIVDVKISVSEGKITIAVQAQTQEAENLIKSEVRSITDAMQRAGLKVEEIQITNNPNLEQQSQSKQGKNEEGALQNGLNQDAHHEAEKRAGNYEDRRSDFAVNEFDSIEKSAEPEQEKRVRPGLYL